LTAPAFQAIIPTLQKDCFVCSAEELRRIVAASVFWAFSFSHTANAQQMPDSMIGSWTSLNSQHCPVFEISKSGIDSSDYECKITQIKVIDETEERYLAGFNCEYDDGKSNESWVIGFGRQPNEMILVIDNRYEYFLVEKCSKPK
jgi:hypothetical protein